MGQSNQAIAAQLFARTAIQSGKFSASIILVERIREQPHSAVASLVLLASPAPTDAKGIQGFYWLRLVVQALRTKVVTDVCRPECLQDHSPSKKCSFALGRPVPVQTCAKSLYLSPCQAVNANRTSNASRYLLPHSGERAMPVEPRVIWRCKSDDSPAGSISLQTRTLGAMRKKRMLLAVMSNALELFGHLHAFRRPEIDWNERMLDSSSTVNVFAIGRCRARLQRKSARSCNWHLHLFPPG